MLQGSKNLAKVKSKKAQNSDKIILDFFSPAFKFIFDLKLKNSLNLPTILAFVPVLLVSDIFAFFLTAKKYEWKILSKITIERK